MYIIPFTMVRLTSMWGKKRLYHSTKDISQYMFSNIITNGGMTCRLNAFRSSSLSPQDGTVILNF